MEATINSAVFSHKFGNNPEVSVHNVVADGVQYQCFAPSILSKIGQKVQFEVTPSKDPKYPPRMKLSEAAGGYSGGGKKPFVAKFADTKEGFVLSQKSYILSYAERLANTYVTVQVPGSFEAVLDLVEVAYKRLLPILELDKIPAEPIQALNPPAEYHLKPVLETILKGKFKSNNLISNRDIIEYCAAFGIEMKNDPNSGDVFINKLSEADANLLINELSRV
jgi:hypothetical protein